ncbi:MAG: FAD-dependent oxidoreductase [Clostridia bacterium]|nr:FAD-dependent oxidoreductase [Clostridia bacterium]
MIDVMVVGGGFAGVGAALAAARQGKRVMIVEEGNAFGGAAHHNLVIPFMPYWTVGENGEKDYLTRGIFQEITSRLKAMGGMTDDKFFLEESLKLLLNRMLIEAGVQILFHAKLVDAKAEHGAVSSVTLALAEGLRDFSAKVYIDATGNGDLAALAGFPTRLGRESDNACQPMTLCFRVGGVDQERWLTERKELQPLYAEKQAKGEIKNPRENILTFMSPLPGVVHFNTTRVIKRSPVSSEELTQAEIEAREQVFEMMAFLKENAVSFQNAYLLSTAPAIGVRESRMIDGETLLSAEDLKACRVPVDTVAVANYDMDIHSPDGAGTSHYYFEPGTYYGIPYAALIPRGSRNLLAAGRCISVTHEAQASVRIMPVCCATGEAAGVAAAHACDAGGVRNISTDTLRRLLRENGQRVD